MKLFRYKYVMSLALLFTGCYYLGGSFVTIPKVYSITDVKQFFPTTTQAIAHNADNAKKQLLQDLEAIYGVASSKKTFDNTIRAMDMMNQTFHTIIDKLTILEMVSPEKDIRDAAHEHILDMNNFSVDHVSQNKRLYQAFIEYVDTADLSKLNAEEQYTIETARKDFKKAGFLLSDEAQEQLKVLKKKIAEYSLIFDKNIAQSNGFITVAADQLSGLSESFIASLEKTDAGLYKVGVDYPTYIMVMENCDNRETRKALWHEYSNRAYPENEAILQDIIALKDDLAKIVGYASYADYDIDGQTAGSSERVEKFLSDLIARSKIKARREFDLMYANLPAGVTLLDGKRAYPWDVMYVKNQYKKEYLAVDELAISQHFPLDNTIQALFDIYQSFFGVRFESVAIDGLWHPDVRGMKVYKGDLFIGYILLDLFPRPNKYSHACMVNLIPTFKSSNELYPALIIVIANFPKPTVDKPALLKRDDVKTFFHEFGHAMHGILGATELPGNAGTSVKRDFVELPSQMLEEWLWQPRFLKQVSKHYQTGEPLSDDIIEKILVLKNYNSGEHTLRQLYLASISLEIYKAGKNKNVHDIIKGLFDKIMDTSVYQNDNHFWASFGHLTGYGAKYYGYLWSQVYALDLFDVIKKHDFSPEIGKKYVDEVLSKGGSEDPMKLLHNFLGRDPKEDAFFKDLGI